MPVTLIWQPAKSKQLDPSHPTLNAPVRFPVVQSAPAGKKGSTQELEVQAQVSLIDGSNLVSEEDWLHMQSNPFVQRFIDAGMLQVIEPRKEEGFVPTGTTTDFSEVEARQIVATSLDLEWLKICIQRETRDSVIKACQRRIQDIENSARKRAVAALASGANNAV